MKCLADVSVSGGNTGCLLNSGSQLTKITSSFSKTHLSEHRIKPFQTLDIEDSNGENVPYLGKLNLLTFRNANTLLSLEEAFSVLAGSRWFSVMNLKCRYYQIEMKERNKPKFYEFNRMPQGITNALLLSSD